MFEVNTFKNALTTQWLGHKVLYFEELESTNTYLKKLPADEISHGLLCLVDRQTKGRGQYEKSWDSQPEKNLTFTIALKPKESGRFHIFTLVCAKAIIDELEEEYGLAPYIRWPNDLYVGDEKIAGLLTESTFSGNKIDRLLVGIGLNVNQEQFPDRLKDIAGSLKLLTGKELSREELLARVLSRIEYGYGRWHKQDPQLLGINEKGQMAVINPEGEIETFSYEQIRIIAD